MEMDKKIQIWQTRLQECGRGYSGKVGGGVHLNHVVCMVSNRKISLAKVYLLIASVGESAIYVS